MTVPELVSTNCRSLSNKMDYLQSLMYSTVYRNPGVLAIQETWLHQHYDDNLVSINGYKVFRQDRKSSKKKIWRRGSHFYKHKLVYIKSHLLQLF
uniref:Uncharacterized protein n=1 Tax=Trichobilharzia regenti TaxID=157069 RepID=A0AA85J6Q8_TRIRE|nr:unnamed protein product [Trichobilharzia regenti]